MRLAAMPLTTLGSDFVTYGSVVEGGRAGAPLYADAVFSYPPLFGYYFELIGRFLQSLAVPTFARPAGLIRYVIPGLTAIDLTTPLVTTLIKLPELAIDAFAAWQVADLGKSLGWNGRTRAVLATLCWLNPMLMWDGAVGGAWDDVVPATALAVLRAARDENWFRAGAWIGLGILAKIVPGYFALPLLAFALRRAGSLRGAAGAGALVVAGILATAGAGLVPVLARHETHAMLRAICTRFGDFTPQGFTPLGLLELDAFARARAFVQAFRSVFVTAYSIAEFGGLAFVVASVLRRPATLRGAIVAVSATLLVLMVSSPYVQPTYVVWIAPLLLLIYEPGPAARRWPARSLGLGTLGFAFAHVVRGTAGTIAPACVFFRLCDARATARAAWIYHARPGVLAWSRQVESNALLGAAGSVALLLVAWYVLAELRRVAPLPVRVLLARREREPLAAAGEPALEELVA